MYRQWRQRLAGLCINTLVSLGSLGSTLFTAPALRFAVLWNPISLRRVARITD